MNYNINPCKSCWEKYQRGDCDINTINDCVVNTAAAFAGVSSNNVLRNTDAGKNWNECMEKMMAASGRDRCDFQLDMAPVWNQSPHYFPTEFANNGNNVKDALENCTRKCLDNKNNQKECINNCITDAGAIEEVEPIPVDPSKLPKNPENHNTKNVFVFHLLLLSIVLFLLFFTLSKMK